MNAISPNKAEAFKPELLIQDLVARFSRANPPARKQESAKARRERQRARVLAAANNDPLAQHPRLMKLRAELQAKDAA